MNPTYKQLLGWLSGLTPEQLEMNVTVHDCTLDEYYPVIATKITDNDNDVLDPQHPFLEIEA